MYRKHPVLMAMTLSLLPVVDSALGQNQSPQSASPTSSPCPIINNLQFPGGTLGDYVKTLQEACVNSNIMIASPDALEIKLPPIKLQSVAFGGAVQLMEGRYALSDMLFAHIGIDKVGDLSDNSVAPIYRVTLSHTGMPYSNSVRVWNIGDLLGADRKAEDVLTAVETAVGLLYVQEKAQIRYHAATTLLVASGKDVQLQAIERVVEGLREGIERGKKTLEQTQLNSLAELLTSLEKSEHPSEHQLLNVMFSFMAGMQRLEGRMKNLEEGVQSKGHK